MLALPLTSPAAESYPASRRISAACIAGVLVAHVVVLVLLTRLDVLPLSSPATPPALSVQIIAPAAPVVEATRPPTPPPIPQAVVRPKPVRTPPSRPVQRLVAAADASPAASSVALASETAVQPSDTPSVSAPPAAPSAVTTSAPVVSTPPRFDAGYLRNPAPVYPAVSRRLGEEGKVVLRVLVESSGRPIQIEVRTGSGSSHLDQAAQEAVSRWTFAPARRGDDAVDAWVLVPIVFNLRS